MDRLKAMGIQIRTTECVLCFSTQESHDHVFYRCSYSQSVLQNVLSWLGARRLLVSLQQVELYFKRKGDSTHRWILIAGLTTLTYCFWEERNYRLYRHTQRTAAEVKELDTTSGRYSCLKGQGAANADDAS